MLNVIFFLCIVGILSSPYKNGSIGVSMDIPDGSTVVATTAIPPFCMIAGSNPSNNWHLRLDRGPNPANLTPKALVLEAKKRVGVPEEANLLENRKFLAGDIEGWWQLIQSPAKDDSTVIGWFVLPAPGQQYIMASVLTDDIGWKMAGNSILASIKSINPLDPVEVISDKMAGLDAATEKLSTINKNSLITLIGFEEWRRIQTVQSEGGTPKDIGYAKVSVSSGTVDNLDTDKSQDNEIPTGIIVTLRSRLIPNPATGVVVDSTAKYWMSWDGIEERWSNRVNRWVDRVSAIESETGIRNRAQLGAPKPKLLVIQQDLTSNKIEPPFETIIEDPWLPRAMVWILGHWLTDNELDKNYIWRTYDNTGISRVVTRSDTVTRGDDGITTITTKFGEENDSLITTIDINGRLIKQKQVGGVLVSGSSEETLRSIWQPKKLW